MYRARSPWHADRLGRLLRDGLADVRTARPDPVVWERISSAIEPSPNGHKTLAARLRALVLLPPEDYAAPPDLRTGRWLVSLRGATLLSLLTAIVLVLGGVVDLGGVGVFEGGSWIAPTSGQLDGLAAEEIAIQPVIWPRSVDLALPDRSASVLREPVGSQAGWHTLFHPPREAYNRSVWLRPAPEPRSGPAHPLRFVNGL